MRFPTGVTTFVYKDRFTVRMQPDRVRLRLNVEVEGLEYIAT